jgi:hypothetical protein
MPNLLTLTGASGPGSAGPVLAYTTGLRLWLKADAITGVADGAAVTTWPDSSNDAIVVTQGTAANKPLYRATGGPNSRPAVDFDGSNDFFDLSTLSVTSGSKSFFIVGNPTDTSGTGQYFFDTSTGRIIIAHCAATGAFNQVGWYDGTWRAIAAATTGNQFLEWVLTSGGNGEVWRNGSSLGTAAYSAKAIGGTTTIGQGNYYKGKISELLIYDTALSAGNRQLVESYISQKYALF